EAMAPLATHLDEGLPDTPYANAVNHAIKAIRHPERTPSARALTEIEASPGGFMAWALERSRQHSEALRTQPLESTVHDHFIAATRTSLEKQKQLEASNHETFKDYLARYYKGIPVAGWPNLQ